MGGIYAREEGLPEPVWNAIYHHYLPVGVEADAPPRRQDLGDAAVSWAAVSLADKLDTLVGLFRAGEQPTGSRDPFGLRRQAHGLCRILADLPELTGLQVRPSLGGLLTIAHDVWGRPSTEQAAHTVTFLRDRLRYVLEERGFDIRNVRAVTPEMAPGQLRPVDARRKLEVLPEFTETPDFRQLATVFKRVKNIAKELPASELRKPGSWDQGVVSLLREPAEAALLQEMTSREAVINTVVDSGANYRRGFAEAAKFGPAVDRFFTEVFVMVDDQKLRTARLHLMKRLERLILQLADVSELVPAVE
jgi:glycyl-tRNA synthetase beta chain